MEVGFTVALFEQYGIPVRIVSLELIQDHLSSSNSSCNISMTSYYKDANIPEWGIARSVVATFHELTNLAYKISKPRVSAV